MSGGDIEERLIQQKLAEGKVEHPEAAKPPEPTVRFMCCTKLVAACYGPQGVFQDAEGFMVCPEHGQRRYGWRSPRSVRVALHPVDPANPVYVSSPVWSESHLQADKVVQGDLFPMLTDDEVVATVNGMPVTAADIEDMIEDEMATKVADDRERGLA